MAARIRLKLRTAQTSDRCFWAATTAEQFDQEVCDQNADYGKRVLPKNEVAVLALNEIAARHRRAFFFHLPSRQSWTSKPNDVRMPLARMPLAPGYELLNLTISLSLTLLRRPDYPTIVAMDFLWTQKSFSTFSQSPQRARYLNSSAMINHVPSYAPIYAIQYASYYRCHIYLTEHESLVLVAAPVAFYLCTTLELDRILGHTQARLLHSFPNIWNPPDAETSFMHEEQMEALANFRHATLEDVYHAVQARWYDFENGLRSTYTGETLQTLIPRPVAASAREIGTPLGTGDSADHPSRRGVSRRSKPRSNVQDQPDDEADLEE